MTTTPIPDSNLISSVQNIASGVTFYVPVVIRDGVACAQVAWKDATSNAAITFEVSNYDSSPTVAGAAWEWGTAANSPTITGPAGTGAGCAVVTVANCWFKQARLKFVTAAVTSLEVRDGGQDGPGVLLARLLDAFTSYADGATDLLEQIAGKR